MPVEKKHSSTFTPENFPCFKEHQLSQQCLDRTHHSQATCDPYFDNYKACKTFWHKVQRERRSQGLTPSLPPLEEREKIKQEYLQSKKN